MPFPEASWRSWWLPHTAEPGPLPSPSGPSLILRLAYVRQFSAHPYGRFPWVDENAYWTWALAIRGGQWLPSRPFYQDPLFAYLLAGLMTLVGSGFRALRSALAVPPEA